MGDGRLPPEQLDRLTVVARWMEAHAASIVGTTPGLAPWQFYGPSTRRGSTVYLHLLMRPYETVTVRGVPIRRVRAVRALGTGTPLAWTSRATLVDTMFNPDPMGELTVAVPEAVQDPNATVVALEIAPTE
jgi:alpha-L-fucosidase